MTSLSGSAFLQALGWAIAGSLWQMALLWTIYQLCFGVWRNIRSSVKTGAATVLQMAGFGWFVCSLAEHYWKLKMAPPTTFARTFSVSPESHDPLFWINRALAWSEHYLPYLSGAYLLVLAFLLARVFKAYRHVQAVRTEGLSKIDVEWRVYVQELAARIGIRRDIRVWLSEKIDIPATIGYLKPLILLPIASFNHLSPEQVEAILLHELAHIKRNDYLLNLILTVMDTVLFFNPFAQLIARHIRTERENSCDDFVLQFRYNPHVYASALLSLEQQRLSPELAMAAAGKTDLLDRIRRIMNVPSRPMNYGQKLMALLITAGILASLAWLTPENIEHKPILKTMAVLLPSPPPVAPVAPEPVIEAPAPAPVKTHHACPAPAPSPRSASDAPSSSPEDDVVIDESQPSGNAVWIAPPTYSPDKVMRMTLNPKTFYFRADSIRAIKFQMDTLQVQLRKAFRIGQEALQQRQDELARVYEDQARDYRAQRLSQTKDEEALRLAMSKTAEAQRLASLKDRQIQLIQLHELELQSRHLSKEQSRRVQEEITQEKKNTVLVIQAIDKKLHDAARGINGYSSRNGYGGRLKAKVLDQQAEDDDNGISADQPEFQTPAVTNTASSRWKFIPVTYTVSQKHKTATAYRERYTLSYSPQASRSRENASASGEAYSEASGPSSASSEDENSTDQDCSKSIRNTSVDLVHKLETDGFLSGSCNVRIVVENNSLTINGVHQSEGVYARYKDCLDGKAIVILSTGKVIQVTVR
ncbi:M56 family metallopeptidase [Dinghuibacter silviterrae]|uniref:BlaR1 peptidase M56 n=1 Tax=Dinghuibacter silviterrae TaxID=1539049 RepID=A0A4R8DH59_9BACT|nr:M56 family metallopeptidase [Dinghuibacter silviterrae]TDW97041.1 BlaR1 peptidase M56 [Dinghuibacter silviterrae]